MFYIPVALTVALKFKIVVLCTLNWIDFDLDADEYSNSVTETLMSLHDMLLVLVLLHFIFNTCFTTFLTFSISAYFDSTYQL